MSIETRRDPGSPRAAPVPRPPAGFTLAELIVALMLLTVGLLALASTSAYLGYEHAASGRAERAATLAGSRLEILRLAGCAANQGMDVTDGLTTTWSVIPVGPTAVASVSASWSERGSPVVHRYATAFAC